MASAMHRSPREKNAPALLMNVDRSQKMDRQRMIHKPYGWTRKHGRGILPIILTFLLVVGCDDSITEGDKVRELTYGFEESAEAWTGDFVDYPTSKTEEDLELAFDRRPLREDLEESGQGLFLAGLNQSDDLFMYLKREVTGLEPNTPYNVTFSVDIASNAPTGCAGIGGPPGEAVVVKAGAATVEPVPIVEDGDYRLNVDNNVNDDATSPESSVQELGNIANGIEQCTGEIPYRMITRDNVGNPLEITTTGNGSLWLFVGTDSGFEGKTALFYDEISVTLDPN